MGSFIASKYLPEQAGILLEEAVVQESKQPPVYFPTHEGRYIITEKNVDIKNIMFTKTEEEWFCEAKDKKLFGKRKRGRPRKKVQDVEKEE